MLKEGLGSSWPLLVKCEGREESRKELLSKKEPELGDFKNQTTLWKVRTLVLKRTLNSHLIKRLCCNSGTHQSSLKKLGIEIRLYQQKHCQLELKGRKEKVYERRWSDFWNSIGLDNRNRAVQLQTCFNLQEKEKMTLKVTEIHEATTLTIGPRPRLHLPWLQRVGHFQKAAGLMPCEVIRVTAPLGHAGDTATPVNLEGRASDQRGYSWDLWARGFVLLSFRFAWGPPYFSFQFLPFGMEMSIPCLFHYCILETHSLSGFTDLPVEEFCLRLNQISSLTWVQWYLNKTSHFRL